MIVVWLPVLKNGIFVMTYLPSTMIIPRHLRRRYATFANGCKSKGHGRTIYSNRSFVMTVAVATTEPTPFHCERFHQRRQLPTTNAYSNRFDSTSNTPTSSTTTTETSELVHSETPLDALIKSSSETTPVEPSASNTDVVTEWMKETRHFLTTPVETLGHDENVTKSALGEMRILMEQWLLQCSQPQAMFLASQLLERSVQLSLHRQSQQQQLSLTPMEDPAFNDTLSLQDGPVSAELVGLFVNRYRESVRHPSHPVSADFVRLFMNRYRESDLEASPPMNPQLLSIPPQETLPLSLATFQLIYNAACSDTTTATTSNSSTDNSSNNNNDFLVHALEWMDSLLRDMLRYSMDVNNESSLHVQPTIEHCNFVLRAWSNLKNLTLSSHRAQDLLQFMSKYDQEQQQRLQRRQKEEDQEQMQPAYPSLHPNLESHLAFCDAYHKDDGFIPGYIQRHLDHVINNAQSGVETDATTLMDPHFLEHLVVSCCKARNIPASLDVMERIQSLFRETLGKTPLHATWLESVLQAGFDQLTMEEKQQQANRYWELVTTQVDCTLMMDQPSAQPTTATWDIMLDLLITLPHDAKQSNSHEHPAEAALELWNVMWNNKRAERPKYKHFDGIFTVLNKRAEDDPQAFCRAEAIFQSVLESSLTEPDLAPRTNMWKTFMNSQEVSSQSIEEALPKLDKLTIKFEEWFRDREKTGPLDKSENDGQDKPIDRGSFYAMLIGQLTRMKSPIASDGALQLLKRLVKMHSDGDKDVLSDAGVLATYLAGVVHVSDPANAESMLRQWIAKELPFDQESFAVVMQAWAESSESDAPERVEALLQELQQLHKSTGEERYEVNKYHYLSLIKAWVQSGRTDSAQRAEQILQQRLKLFPDDDARNETNMVMSAWALGGNTDRVELLLRKVVANYLFTGVYPPERIHFRQVLVAHKFSDGWNAASKGENVIRQMTEISQAKNIDCWPDREIYTMVMQSWATSNRGATAFEHAEALYKDMLAFHHAGVAKTQPDSQVYIALLSCLSNSGLDDLVQTAWTIHQDMITEYGVELATPGTYSALLGCILKSKSTGKKQQVRDVFHEMEQLNVDVDQGLIRVLLGRCIYSSKQGGEQQTEAFEVACEVIYRVLTSQKGDKTIPSEWETFQLFFKICQYARNDEATQNTAKLVLNYCLRQGWKNEAQRAYQLAIGYKLYGKDQVEYSGEYKT